MTLKSLGKQWYKSYWNGYECNLPNNTNFASKVKGTLKIKSKLFTGKARVNLDSSNSQTTIFLFSFFSPKTTILDHTAQTMLEVLMRLECAYIKLGFKGSKKNRCLKGPHKKSFKGEEHMWDINNISPKWWKYSKGAARRCRFQPLFWQYLRQI